MNGAQRGAAALLVVSLLAGCSAGATDIDQETSTQMQGAVQEIAVTAEGGDYGAAVVRLNALQAQLDQSLQAGRVGGARGVQIQTAIDQVRADLDAIIRMPVRASDSPSTRAPPPSPDSGKATGDSGKPKERQKDSGDENP